MKPSFIQVLVLGILVAFALGRLAIGAVSAQDAKPIVIPNPKESASAAVPPVEAAESVSPRDPLTSFFRKSITPYEFWLVVIIAVMTLGTIALICSLVARSGVHQPRDIWLPAIVLSIIGGILISVTAGYRNEQIGPAFGLFGTMIGYLLRSLQGGLDLNDSDTGIGRATEKRGSSPPGPASASGAGAKD